jgi:hypothetical protein
MNMLGYSGEAVYKSLTILQLRLEDAQMDGKEDVAPIAAAAATV